LDIQGADGTGAVGAEAAGAQEVRDFEDLVALYDRRLYNLILRLVGDRDDAADLTQEAFYRAYRSWDSLKDRSRAYPWLCRIALNLCRNRARDAARRPEEPLETDAAPGDGGVHGAVERAELARRIREAMDALPPEYRVVAVLRDMQGLSYQEIAEATGLGVDVVRTRLARARGMLRRRLEGFV
jgi:RNA polymerase sigma-70 factor (ECF subfamily)